MLVIRQPEDVDGAIQKIWNATENIVTMEDIKKFVMMEVDTNAYRAGVGLILKTSCRNNLVLVSILTNNRPSHRLWDLDGTVDAKQKRTVLRRRHHGNGAA